MHAITRTAAAAVLVANAGALAQTEVPRGGATVCTGAGSAQVLLTLTNKTGVPAKDVTISVFNENGGAVPDITDVDVLETDNDVVDDDGDGQVDDDEDDTTDDSPGKTAKSIFTSGQVNDDGTINVTVKLNADLPDGACFRVKFSTEIGGTHYDLIAVLPVSPEQPFCATDITPGAAQVAPGLALEDDQLGIQGFQLFTMPDNPVIDVQLPEPHVPIIIDEEPLSVQIEPPLPGGQANDLGLTFVMPFGPEPQPLDLNVFIVPLQPPCLADWNEDGVVDVLDFIAYQNSWQIHDPLADLNNDGIINVLDFIEFQEIWQAGCN